MRVKKMIFDMHCHTTEGSPDASVKLEETIERLIEKGYDGMVVTDHNSYRGYNSLSKKYSNFKVLRGVEYDSLDGGHLLIILPTNIKYEIFQYRGMLVEDVIKIVHTLGGIIGPAHPFDYGPLGICNTKWKTNLDLLNKFDFIETFNGCLDKKGSVLATCLASHLDKPCFAGSDSHHLSKVGLVKTIINEKIENEDDLIKVVKNAKYNTFKTAGDFCERKHRKIHSFGVLICGYGYSILNKCLSVNHNKSAHIILKKLGEKE